MPGLICHARVDMSCQGFNGCHQEDYGKRDRCESIFITMWRYMSSIDVRMKSQYFEGVALFSKILEYVERAGKTWLCFSRLRCCICLRHAAFYRVMCTMSPYVTDSREGLVVYIIIYFIYVYLVFIGSCI